MQIKNLNHRDHRVHRVNFSIFFSQDLSCGQIAGGFTARLSFFSKPSEKHERFSEGLLKKETLAEKVSLCSLSALWLFSLWL
jgi:hypothetical protein